MQRTKPHRAITPSQQPDTSIGYLWQCPENDCTQSTVVSIEDVADIGSFTGVGTPICPDCDCDMHLVPTVTTAPTIDIGGEHFNDHDLTQAARLIAVIDSTEEQRREIAMYYPHLCDMLMQLQAYIDDKLGEVRSLH